MLNLYKEVTNDTKKEKKRADYTLTKKLYYHISYHLQYVYGHYTHLCTEY